MYMMGNLSGSMHGNATLWRFVVLYRGERAFCEVGSLKTIVRMERNLWSSISF